MSPFRERKDGTVTSAEAIDASVVSSPRKCEVSVSPENSLLEPFISSLICAIRFAACCRYPRDEYPDRFAEFIVPLGEGSLLDPSSGTLRKDGRADRLSMSLEWRRNQGTTHAVAAALVLVLQVI